MVQPWYDVEEILPDIIRVNDGELDTSYILKGTERTGVIDTGMGIGDLASVVASVSSARPLVINTHAHPDHWQGNYQFEETSMGALEWEMVQGWMAAKAEAPEYVADEGPNAAELMGLKRSLPPEFDPSTYTGNRFVTPTQVWQDGDVIDLGGFRLEVIVVPAHTQGSIALLDRGRRVMFTGDTVLFGPIWLQLEESTGPETAFASYERLAGYADAVDHVLPGHNMIVHPASFLTDFWVGAQKVRRGEIEPVYTKTFAGNGWRYDLGGYGFLFREKVPV